MKPPDPLHALSEMAGAFRELEVRWYVGGSVASSTRGLARASIDVDVVADLRPGVEGPLAARLRGSFYLSEEAVREAIQERSSFNAIHLPTAMKVDVFVPTERPFDRSALDRATLERLDPDGTGPDYPVATAEDVVISKLEWFRRGGEVSQRQWADVLGVLRIASREIDRAYMEKMAASLGVGNLFARALEEAGFPSLP
jgi:hypothetical protein